MKWIFRNYVALKFYSGPLYAVISGAGVNAKEAAGDSLEYLSMLSQPTPISLFMNRTLTRGRNRREEGRPEESGSHMTAWDAYCRDIVRQKNAKEDTRLSYFRLEQRRCAFSVNEPFDEHFEKRESKLDRVTFLVRDFIGSLKSSPSVERHGRLLELRLSFLFYLILFHILFCFIFIFDVNSMVTVFILFYFILYFISFYFYFWHQFDGYCIDLTSFRRRCESFLAER